MFTALLSGNMGLFSEKSPMFPENPIQRTQRLLVSFHEIFLNESFIITYMHMYIELFSEKNPISPEKNPMSPEKNTT